MKGNVTIDHLLKINIMDVLPEATLARLAGATPMIPVTRGETILQPGTVTSSIYMLKEGRVRLYVVSSDGREFTLGLLGPGNMFGEIQAFTLMPPDAYAVAVEDSVLCALRRDDLDQLVHEHPELGLRMIEVLSQRLWDSEQRLQQLALADVRTRLGNLLLRLAVEFGQPESGTWVRLDANLTQQDLATMVGATRESVTNVLSQFARQGLAETGRKIIRIKPDEMRAFLEETYGSPPSI
ncbi:MAG: Crp/Fnr family transcriptional regulator [Thermaerobacterales bacterium]